MLKQISHLGVAVKNIEQAMDFYKSVFHVPVSSPITAGDIKVSMVEIGDSSIELIQPISDKGVIAKFLEKRGQGIHHVCFEVDDILAYITRLQENGMELINEEPVIGTGGKLIAFIHPESTHGVLVELYELTQHEPQIRLARARQLADRAVARGQEAAAGVLAFLRQLRDPGDSNGKE